MRKSYLNEAFRLLCRSAFVIFSFFTLTVFSQQANIDLNVVHQEIKGFGGINHPTWYTNLNASERALAFGNGPGQMGLTVLRTFVSQNPNEWGLGIETAQYAANAGATVFASPWNPPANMTITVDGQKRINPNSYADYANHLNNYVTYMANNGVDLYAISTQNEPDYAHDWTEWSPQESVDFIKGYANQIDCRLITPESFQYRKNVYDPILNDPQALANVDIFGTHLYGTQYADFPYPNFEQKGGGKELWMTEVYTDSQYDANIWDNSVINQNHHALKVAEHIHYAMTEGQFQTYVFWPLRRYYALIHDGANASTPFNGVSPAQAGTITKRGYCMAQFSKWIRPGFVRVEATKSPSNNVFVSAYKNNDGQVVIVVVNKNTSTRNLTLNIPGLQSTTWERYTTSATKSLAKGSDINANSSFQVTLDAASVTTFVGSGETAEQGNIVVRAAGTAGDETLQLIVDGNVLTTWTLSAGMATYSYDGPSNGVFRLNYTNDADGRDVQVDYLQVDGTVYQAEDQQINTGSYANGACGGGEYTEMMYCSGYIEFNLVDPNLDSDNDGTPDVDDDCPNDPNKTTPGNCGCGNPETCPTDDYQTHVDWAIPGGNQGLAACKAKFLGNIVPSSWSGTPIIRNDWGTYWNQMSQENAGKWGVVEGNQDQYNWGDLDIMYDYCEQNGVPFKHHVFIWGSQQPEWLADLPANEQLAEVEEWYSLFQQRYPNTAIIDVVNESLPGHAPDVAARDAMGGFNNGASVPYLANHPYLAKYGYGTGWDYIIYAFAKARDYFPDAILVLNDYNIINNVNNLNAHLEIVEILKERNLIDAVGIQSHAFSVDNLSANALENNLDLLASAGLPIHVTELDIRGDNGNEQQQLERYQRLVPIFYEHPAVAGVTLWGYVEGQNWFDYTGILNADGSERAAMTWLKQYMASQPDVCNVPDVTVELITPTTDTAVVIPSEVYIEAVVSDPSEIETLRFYANGEQVGATEYLDPYFTTLSITESGTYEITAEITLPNGGGQITSAPIVITANVPQSPYNGTPHAIPGTIQLEEFDLGGNGFAYYDDTEGSETGVAFRNDEDVDIEESADPGSSYNIGWTSAGEWLEYTVDVTEAGTYDIDLRLARNGDNGSVRIEMDGEDITGSVAVPNTGGWQAWETVTIEGVELTAGEKVMRVAFETQYTNFNFVSFELQIVDTDNDGTPDVSDACPNDPNKAATAGDCGCGVPDTDTDADGIADCNDTYPNDADNDGVNTNDDCDDNDDQIGAATVWYQDLDGDGLGNGAVMQESCTQPDGYVAQGGDNNDTDADNDGVNTTDDCDDNNATVGEETTWYLDADGDGVGIAGTTMEACTQPDGYVSEAGDECPNDINKTLPGDCGCGATEESCLDCAGTPNGDAFYDDCENCVASEQDACTQDCFGDWGGTAEYDVCNQCAGGNTGIVPVTDPQNCIATGFGNEVNDELMIYPNPTTGDLYLPESISWVLRNARGEQLLEGTSSQLNLSTLSDGLYFLQIDGKVIKVVKE